MSLISSAAIAALIPKLVDNYLDKTLLDLHQIGKNAYNKYRIRTGLAFTSYLETASEKYSQTKSILYRNAPVFIYDNYVPAVLIYGKETAYSNNIGYLANITNKMIISGNAGSGKSTLLKDLF